MATTRALEDAEIFAMFSTIGGRYAVRNRTMLIVAIHMALRATELCSLCVDDVYDGTNGRRYVTIRPETAKRNKQRKIRMSSDVRKVLADFIAYQASHRESTESDEPLFVSQMGGHLSRKTLFVIVKRIMEKASALSSNILDRFGNPHVAHSLTVESSPETVAKSMDIPYLCQMEIHRSVQHVG